MYDIVIGRGEKDKEKYGTRGTILLGKHFVQMGRTTSLSNPVYMDMTRSHVVFVCGKRGGGKCVSGDTLITLGDGSVRRIDQLEKDDHEILSLQKNLKIQKTEKEGFYTREVNKIFEIVLRSGKKIKLTPEHPLLTVDGWKRAEELKLGSRIATPRVQAVFGEEDLNEDEVKILAYLIAEGHIGNGFILFTNKDQKLMNEFKSSIASYDKKLCWKEHGEYCIRVVEPERKRTVTGKRDKEGRFTINTAFDKQNSLRKRLEELSLYEKLSDKKFIPQEIFKLPKQKLAIFLNRLFSCDGSIYKEGNNFWKISYSSSSEQLAREVQHLLERFEIHSSLRKKKTSRKPAFELEIKGIFVHSYLQNIGFFGQKEGKQKIALKESISLQRNTNIDTIPKEIWDQYKPENWTKIGKSMGYKHPKALRESTRYAPSRQKLAQIAIYDQNEHILSLAQSDIFWDEIVSMTTIEEKTKVYDFTVPENHNFVANDIIVHNSYTMGVMAEGMADMPWEIRQNISVIMLDTMGIYWTMKYPNKKDKDLLDQWGLKGKGLDVKIYTPTGYYKEYKDKGIPTDAPFSVKPAELDPNDWLMTLDIEPSEPVGVLIERVIHELTEKHGNEYSLQDIKDRIMNDEDADKNTKLAAKNRFANLDSWGLFDEKGTPISDLAVGGQITVLDVSCYATQPGSWNVKNLVIGLVAQKLFIQRMIARKDEEYNELHKSINPFTDDDIEKQDFPMVWLVIDEAHEFLPVKGKTLATDPLITILREGRQPGVSLVLATQQPGKIHTDVMTQSDTVIAHRITARLDTEALGMLMQSYMRKGLVEELDQLPRLKGAALIFDDTNERLYPMRVRPRFTWHGGEAPNAMKNAQDEFKL